MKLFITGISTDVGKTITAAIITEALEADYWKPVQSGDIENSDSIKIGKLLSNTKSVIHPESYRLCTPVSPHLAAQIDEIAIDINKIIAPTTKNHLVIEGAGGIFVPINDNETIADLIREDYKVVIVSRHYLGSINHTLLTVEALQNRKANIAGIIFNGAENPASEEIILKKTGIKLLGRIDEEPYFDKEVVSEYAAMFKTILHFEL